MLPPKTARLRTLLGVAAALGLVNSVGIAFAPALLTHAPLALLALAPLYRHLVLAATKLDFLPFVLVAVPARMPWSVLGYALGRGYGEQGMDWVHERRPRIARWLRALERGFEHAAGLLLFAWPVPLFCAFAGAARMSAWRFALIASAGQLVQVVVAYRLGERFAPWLRPIVVFFREYMLWATLGCVLAVVIYHYVRRSRREVAPARSRVATSEVER